MILGTICLSVETASSHCGLFYLTNCTYINLKTYIIIIVPLLHDHKIGIASYT